jgi:hypothetical protein
MVQDSRGRRTQLALFPGGNFRESASSGTNLDCAAPKERRQV